MISQGAAAATSGASSNASGTSVADTANTADLCDLSPVPTLVVSPAFRIQRVSQGIEDAWHRGRHEFLGKDLFTALYGGSPLERFDRIPLARAIEEAVAARSFRHCYAVYSARGVAWTARIIPIFRGD